MLSSRGSSSGSGGAGGHRMQIRVPVIGRSGAGTGVSLAAGSFGWPRCLPHSHRSELRLRSVRANPAPTGLDGVAQYAEAEALPC